MQTLVHDYTKPAKVDDYLYEAYWALRSDRPGDALDYISEARELLQAYLAADNMVPDDDTASGWIRATK